MSYATIMVHLEPGVGNSSLLRIAGDVADRFEARLVGIAVCQPMMMVYNEGYISADLIQIDNERIKMALAAVEAEFRAAFAHRANPDAWRSTTTMEPVADYIAGQARCADLIVASVAPQAPTDRTRGMNLGDLIMQAGRPVLTVPALLGSPNLSRVVIGWKDTREARQAIVNALPLLRRASHVVIVEIVADDRLDAAKARLMDVALWLKRHGIAAEPHAVLSTGEDIGQLNDIAETQDADIIVAGAYGHSRLREWAFGGMTRDLLQHTDRCSLVSH